MVEGERRRMFAVIGYLVGENFHPGPVITPSKKGWKFSPTRYPITASIDTRPCVTSASRYRFISFTVKSFVNSSGSKFPNGVIAPGRPAQKDDLSAVQPLMHGITSVGGETLEKAAALPTNKESAKITFMVLK